MTGPTVIAFWTVPASDTALAADPDLASALDEQQYYWAESRTALAAAGFTPAEQPGRRFRVREPGRTWRFAAAADSAAIGYLLVRPGQPACVLYRLRHPDELLAAARAFFGAAAGRGALDCARTDRETFTLDSRAVGERRTINVYLPPAYRASPEKSFPVLYMPDGGLEEDFPHVAGTIDSLIALAKIPPVIVVGIENTQRRRDMTGPTTVARDSTIAPRVGGSEAFRAFIRDELMPAVRTRYRTTDETAIVGESLAGLFVVETFLLEPRLFRRYVALDPSLWWNGGELVRTAERRLRALDARGRTLYVAASHEPEIAADAATFAAALERHAPRELDWRFESRPDLEHGTIYRGASPAIFARVLR
ncbi:MAG TPA: alpha/beta hydrolase-fold protein [Gemmatimonadales bacterium]|nr:alpha/beta hydrolase-fold protein [Gemmatimonadales bacterium]